MTNALTTFTFAPTNANVRVVTVDGNPWFLANDVCAVLGFKPDGNSYAHHVRYHLGTDERQGYPRTALGLAPGKPFVIISKSGLFKLVMRSDKPEARKFQDWVTRVVLPAIEQDGMYVMGEEKVATGETTVDELEAQLMQAAARKLRRLFQGLCV